jgi:phosphoribosylamine--glycine ligase
MHIILLLGSGGREHTFAIRLSKSKHCGALYIAPGNAGTATCGQNVDLNPLDFEAVMEFIRLKQVTLVVVGPEEPLVNGIQDYLASRGVLVVGPSQAGAMLEGSKAWAKEFMIRHGIPTATYREFTAATMEEGLNYVASHPLPIVLKADGLAAGKGVVICEERAAAQAELREMLGGKFGQASTKVVVESFLKGIEFSVFAITDGKSYKILPEAKDYKRVGEGDVGLNTGGMGAVSPVPFVGEEMWAKVENRIIAPTVAGLQKEQIDYKGFLFFGLIAVNGEPYVIEYNCRMGDPETEVVLMRLKNDLVELCVACASGRLGRKVIKMDKRAAATVMLVSGGYPGVYEKGKEIKGLEQVKGSIVLHAGTREESGRVVSSGGRVLAVTSFGTNLPAALKKSYKNIRKIDFEGMYYRRDIGKDVIQDL